MDAHVRFVGLIEAYRIALNERERGALYTGPYNIEECRDALLAWADDAIACARAVMSDPAGKWRGGPTSEAARRILGGTDDER